MLFNIYKIKYKIKGRLTNIVYRRYFLLLLLFKLLLIKLFDLTFLYKLIKKLIIIIFLFEFFEIIIY